MAANIVELHVEGVAQLIAGFELLPEKFQRKVLAKVTRASAKRLHALVVENLSGRVVTPRTGRWLRSAQDAPVRSRKFRRRSGYVGAGFAFPTRAEVGIDPGSKHFYPAAEEYGTPTMAAKAPIRRAVNDAAAFEEATMITEMRKGVITQARKAFAP